MQGLVAGDSLTLIYLNNLGFDHAETKNLCLPDASAGMRARNALERLHQPDRAFAGNVIKL
jgi:hypothetical protein